ncbi:hypothetical protein V8F20_008577 [Naviculisporaceae sp. PSN 640]
MELPSGDGHHSTGIFKLPTEILWDICAEIQGPLDDEWNPPDTDSLARLARTCKLFATVVKPILYQHLSLHLRRHRHHLPKPSLGLLRSLAKGDVKDHVISADIWSLVSPLELVPMYGAPIFVHQPRCSIDHDKSGLEWRKENGHINWSNQLLEDLRTRLRAGVLDEVLQPPYRWHQLCLTREDIELVIKGLRTEHIPAPTLPEFLPREEILTWDLIVPLFLATLPNLVRCRLPIFGVNCDHIRDGPPLYRVPFSDRTTTTYNDASPAFPRLTELEIVLCDRSLMQPNCISYLLENSPNLSILRLWGFDFFPVGVDFSQLRLTTLSIGQGHLGFHDITQLVSSCKGLKVLELSLDDMGFGPPTIRESLPFMLKQLAGTPSASTLRTLKIEECVTSRSLADITEETSASPSDIPSRTRFPSLKSICVAEKTLFHPGLEEADSMMGPEGHSKTALLDLLREVPTVESITIFDIDAEHDLPPRVLAGVLRCLVENLWSIPSAPLKRIRFFYRSWFEHPTTELDSMVKLFASHNIELVVNAGIYGSNYYRSDRIAFTPTDPL